MLVALHTSGMCFIYGLLNIISPWRRKRKGKLCIGSSLPAVSTLLVVFGLGETLMTLCTSVLLAILIPARINLRLNIHPKFKSTGLAASRFPRQGSLIPRSCLASFFDLLSNYWKGMYPYEERQLIASL